MQSGEAERHEELLDSQTDWVLNAVTVLTWPLWIVCP